jgi:uncharacterized membrane protein YwaF
MFSIEENWTDGCWKYVKSQEEYLSEVPESIQILKVILPWHFTRIVNCPIYMTNLFISLFLLFHVKLRTQNISQTL